MGKEMLLEKIRQYKELAVFIRELSDEMDLVKSIIVNEMDARQVDEMVVDVFTVRNTQYTTSRIDSQMLKKELPDVAQRYTKTTEARRFSIG